MHNTSTQTRKQLYYYVQDMFGSCVEDMFGTCVECMFGTCVEDMLCMCVECIVHIVKVDLEWRVYIEGWKWKGSMVSAFE